jgi:hypothetical protein
MLNLCWHTTHWSLHPEVTYAKKWNSLDFSRSSFKTRTFYKTASFGPYAFSLTRTRKPVEGDLTLERGKSNQFTCVVIIVFVVILVVVSTAVDPVHRRGWHSCCVLWRLRVWLSALDVVSYWWCSLIFFTPPLKPWHNTWKAPRPLALASRYFPILIHSWAVVWGSDVWTMQLRKRH